MQYPKLKTQVPAGRFSGGGFCRQGMRFAMCRIIQQKGLQILHKFNKEGQLWVHNKLGKVMHSLRDTI